MVGGALDVIADHRVAASLTGEGSTAAERATALRPDSIRYWLAAADARARADQLPLALTRLDRALAISPLDPILLATKGRVLLAIAGSTGANQDVTRAVTFYEGLLTADPHNAQNALRAGTAYALANDLGRAEEAFLVATDLAPASSVPLANLARIYLSKGDLGKAVDAYGRAAALDPATPGLDEIARALEASGANIGG
jgi:tetratricopeptide (TPR) repeat protein